MLSGSFWSEAFERAAKSFAQALIALWGAGVIDLLHVDFVHSASVAAGAAVLSVLTSLVSLPVGPSGSASMVDHAEG